MFLFIANFGWYPDPVIRTVRVGYGRAESSSLGHEGLLTWIYFWGWRIELAGGLSAWWGLRCSPARCGDAPHLQS